MKTEFEKEYFPDTKRKISCHFLPPPLRLGPYVKFFIFGEADTSHLTKYFFRPVSNECINLYFHYGYAPISFDHKLENPQNSPCFVTGLFPLSELKYIRLGSQTKCVVVVLKPGAFSCFFKYPANDISSQIINLELIIGKEIQYILEQLADATSVCGKYTIIENFLWRQLKQCKATSIRCQPIIDKISCFNGNIRVSDLCKQFKTTKKSLERSFQQEIGIGPKSLTRIIRFHEIYHHLIQNGNKDLSDKIYKLGYYDQAHFINEFKTATGISPQAFLIKHLDISALTEKVFILLEQSDIQALLDKQHDIFPH